MTQSALPDLSGRECEAMLAILDQYSKVIRFSDLPDPRPTWELERLIGEGTYGEIHQAVHKESGEQSSTAFTYIHTSTADLGFTCNIAKMTLGLLYIYIFPYCETATCR